MKLFLKYTSLNVLGMLGISCYILADTFFVANGVGRDGLAALNLAIPVYSLIHGFALMFGVGGATKYTIAKSQGEHLRAAMLFTHVLVFALCMAVIFVSAGMLLSPQITALLGADVALAQMTDTYVKVILLFAPFFMANQVLIAFVRCDGAPELAMTAMVVGSLANIALDYVFIYPFQLGLFGAALATGIAPVVSMMVLSVHKRRGSCGLRFVRCPICFEHILSSMILGFPSFVTEISSGLVIVVFNRIVLSLAGNVGVAAYGVIANTALVSTSVYSGISQGIQPLVSAARGANDWDTVEKYLKYAMNTVVLLSMAVYIGIYCFAPQIAAVFNSGNDPQLQTIARSGMRLYFTSILFTGINVVLAGFFTSTETPMPAHVISLLRGLILVIPMAGILSALYGLTGMWLAVPVTEAIVTLFGAILWHKKKQPRCSELFPCYINGRPCAVTDKLGDRAAD